MFCVYLQQPATQERTMKKNALLAFGVLLFCATVFSQPDDHSRQEQQLVDQLHDSRRHAGLPALTVNAKLTAAAREHSQRMAQQNKLSHELPGEASVANRLAATGVRFN